MLANLIKSLSNKSQFRSTYLLTRQLCARKEISTAKQISNEEEEALKIEASLFEQSSLKYEPVTAAEVLRKKETSKSNVKDHKITMIKNKSIAVPIKKKTRSERESDSKVINDEELGLEFIKLSLNDPRLTTLLITARSKKKRDKASQIIVEGRRLILEALECGLKLNTIIFSQKEQLVQLKEQLKQYPGKIYKVPHHDLKMWSTLTTPPGVMAIFERPSLEYIVNRLSDSASSSPLPVTVVCDNIREPNNLGSIIRTCAAIPCFQIIITKGCCDPWESKALRGGCGGHFRVPIRDNVDWPDVALMIPPEAANDCCVFIAENNLQKLENQTRVVEYADIEKTGSHNVVVIGGESHGVSEDAYRFMANAGSRGNCLYIPLAEGIDSLNVASALTLILYELRKSLLKTTEESTITTQTI